MKHTTSTFLLLFCLFSAALSAADVRIDSFIINGDFLSKQDTLKLSSGDDLIILLGEVTEEFTYKLVDSLNQNTIEGVQNNSLLLYPDLIKGFYTLQVTRQGIDIPILLQRPLTIQVEGTLMRNWWFVPLLMLYLLLLFGGARYFTMLSGYRGKEKLLELRSEWTNRLHNDIGGDLSSVSLRLDTLRRKLQNDHMVLADTVTKVSSILDSVQKKMRFVFDLVDPKKDSLHVMLENVHDFAQENMALKGIQLDYQNELDAKINYGIDIGRVNKLYMAIKEVLNNCVKSSNATHAKFLIRPMKKGLYVEIGDDGVGFDPELIGKGNGLQNLRQYTKEGFIDIQIKSAPDEGTKITMEVPKL